MNTVATKDNLSYAREALRVARLQAPHLHQLPRATPLLLLGICALDLLVTLTLQYAMVPGPSRFYPQAIAAGWFSTVALALGCWALRFSPAHAPAPESLVVPSFDDPITEPPEPAALGPDAATLLAVALLAALAINTLSSLIYIPLYRMEAFSGESSGLNSGTGAPWLLQWLMWVAGAVWVWVAQVQLLSRFTQSSSGSLISVALISSAFVMHLWAAPAAFWYADDEEVEGEKAAARAAQTHLKPANLLKQAGVFEAALAALPPERPSVVDTYVITYSPYASEDVFLKESEVVSRVMAERFGTGARTLRLVNHISTVATLPWATPENLQAAIAHVGTLMNPAEDLLFIHFASHGGSDGQLESRFWPLQIANLGAAEVRTWLDDAGVATRIISVSACYSGGWVPALKSPGTLVMTASDAEHTSYGCGVKSELTYYTRAVFAEQLAVSTRSFEKALFAARPIIEAREIEGGKKDGFSNPQIDVGTEAKARIDRWLAEIDAQTGGLKSP